MAAPGNKYEIDGTWYKQDDKIIALEFSVKVTNEKGETSIIKSSVDEDEYKDLTVEKKGQSLLPWEKFIKVLKPLLLGKPEAEIEEAFKILDADKSGSVEIKELIVFLAAKYPGCAEATLQKYFDLGDKDHDKKMTKAEFSEFCKQDIGKQIIVEAEKNKPK